MGCFSSEILLRFVLKTAQIQLQSKWIKTHIMLLFQEQQQVEDTAAVMALPCWMPGTGSSTRQKSLLLRMHQHADTQQHKWNLSFSSPYRVFGTLWSPGVATSEHSWPSWFGREVEVNWVLIPGVASSLPLCPRPCHLPCSTPRGRDPPGPPQKPI